MSIQPYQLLFLIGYALLALGFWKINNRTSRIVIVLLGFVIFTVNPVRHKQEGGAELERSVSRFSDVPEKVIVEAISFQQKQLNQMKQLKTDSENLKHEIQN